MQQRKDVMKSVYWVFTLRCNDFCDHCYNDSGPKGEVLDTGELLKVVPNLLGVVVALVNSISRSEKLISVSVASGLP